MNQIGSHISSFRQTKAPVKDGGFTFILLLVFS
jgi:hypothetical protein